MTACVEQIGTGSAELGAFLLEGCIVQGAHDRLQIGWGGVRRSATPEVGRLSVYAPDFFLRDPEPWRVYERSSSVAAHEIVDRLEAFASAPPLEWRSSSYSEFKGAFEDVQRRIAKGLLIKAVPFVARRAKAAFDAPRRAATLARALRRCTGTPLRTYGLWNARAGMIGTTPETLFEERLRRGEPPYLRTMALAGTRTPDAPSLLADPKEMHEHRVVVDGLVERLAPLGRVVVGRTDEIHLPTLVHLHTPVEAYPDRPVGFGEWVAALHPTAAIGAWPKEAGWRWLLEQPNADERVRYGAPFGVVPPDEAAGSCLVAIRNVQWEGDEARILAGGGIVAESQVDREWREFNAKLDAIQGALGL